LRLASDSIADLAFKRNAADEPDLSKKLPRHFRATLETETPVINLPNMTTELAAQIMKMTKRQKLNLANQLLGAAGARDKPSAIRSSAHSALPAELHRRLSDRNSGAWLSLDDFRARTKTFG